MPKQETVEIEARITDDVRKGVYANWLRVTYTKEEFFLDFINVFTPEEAVVTSRVIITPSRLKERMIEALNKHLKAYEEKFGRITKAEKPD